MNRKPIVLAIGGFDPSAGAGILADIKTIEALGGYGMAVLSANTFQNESEFDRTDWVSDNDILAQIAVLERKHTFSAVKIGLIYSLDLVYKIAKHFGNSMPIVWDPVLKATAGFEFHTEIEAQQLNELLQSIAVITPNLPEAEKLWGTNKVETLMALHCKSAILLKGGHSDDNSANDILLCDGNKTIIRGDKFIGFGKHGTGCVLSSAIATGLATGMSMEVACSHAKKYVEHIMKSNSGLLAYHNHSIKPKYSEKNQQ